MKTDKLQIKESNALLWAFFVGIFLFHFLVMPGSTLNLYADILTVAVSGFLAAVFLLSLVLGSLIFALIKGRSKPTQSFFTAMGVLSVMFVFYNFYFLDYSGKIIGADSDVFDNNYALLDYLIFALATVLIALAAFEIPRLVQKGLLIGVFATSTSMLIPLISSSFEQKQAPQEASDKSLNPAAFSYSEDHNIIHIILDGMEGNVFKQMIEADESHKENFTGFTFFPDTLAASEITYLSLGSIFSGQAYDGNERIFEYLNRNGLGRVSKLDADKKSTLIKRLTEADYDIDIIAADGGTMRTRPFYRSHIITELEQDIVPDTGATRLLDLTLVKTMPWVLKRKIYREGQWYFSYTEANIPRANRAHYFLTSYSKKITRNNAKPTYKLIHLLTPHYPLTTSDECTPISPEPKIKGNIKDQAKCAIIALETFFAGLKKKGLYDNSTFIISGDHGICNRKKPSIPGDLSNIPACFGNAQPIFLIKPAGQQTPFSINLAEISLTDTPTFVDAAITKNLESTIDRFSREQKRLRQYFKFEPNRVVAAKKDQFDLVKKYDVRGSLEDPKSWTETIFEPVIKTKTLKIGDIIKISKAGKNDLVVWVSISEGDMNRQMYILSGDEKLSIRHTEKNFTFQTPKDYPNTPIFIVDPRVGLKQEIIFKKDPPKPATINPEDLKVGKIITVSKFGQNEQAMWVSISDGTLHRYMYLLSGDEKISITTAEKNFTFKPPQNNGVAALFLVDPISGLKQELSLTKGTDKPKLVNIKDLIAGKIITISRSGKNERAIWVSISEGTLNRQMYLLYGDEKISITTSEKNFTFKEPKINPDAPLYLVDPKAGLKQEIVLPYMKK